MGQHYIAVNPELREFVDPCDIGGFYKLYEWCANPQAGIFPYLLCDTGDDPATVKRVGERPAYLGRWRSCPVCLLGDHDQTGRYQEVWDRYRNISHGLMAEYRTFIEPDHLEPL